MVAILRKKTERDAAGKESSFRVRGQPVTMDDVFHYFKRKKGTQEMGISAATTPSDISCWTPSPSPVHTPQPIDNDIQVVPNSSMAYRDTSLPFASAYNDAYADVSGGGRTITPPFVVNRHITRPAPRGIYNSLSKRARITRSPSPPPNLLVPELLLVKIQTYFEGSFERETWITDAMGQITNITSAATTVVGTPFDLLQYIRTAVELVRMGSLVEFRRLLSKAFNLVQGLLRGEHPLTLFVFLDIIINLSYQGHPEIVSLLRSYIKEMATNTIARENPWGDICRLLGMLDGESLEQAIIQCWKCTHDTFKRGLGPFHTSTIEIFVSLILRTKNLLEEEKVLRELLAQSEQALGVSSSSLLMVMYNLGVNLRDQRKYLEAEELGRQILDRAEDIELHGERLVQKITALEFIAWVQYSQKENDQAEKTMRDVIKMIVDRWGAADLWAINNTIYLEQWLRSWGREEDAYKLRAEREGLIEEDEIDEQSAGEQNLGGVIN